VGRISGLFGAHGDVRVRPLGRFPERFRELHRVYLGERFEPAAILHRRIYRSGDQDGVVLRLDILHSRDAARERIGQYVYVPESEAVPLPEGEYFVHQIVGLAVRTAEGEDLGTVAEVLQTGSNDVYVVKGPRGEVLLPATREVIKEFDLDARTLVVQLLPGLVEGLE
jgi:16S rRNA processing protein RimM